MSEPTEQDLKHILDNVNFIRKKYDDIAKITGENFNIFSVFKKVYHENYHSALISELLNEKGLHEQGRLYLDLFITILNNRINDEKLAINEIINFKNSTSVTEKVTDNNDRIDIYIEDDNQIIIIENKIGAIDQDLQLKRYFDFIKNKGKSFCIIYLWKDYIDVTKYNEDIKNNTFGDGNEVREKTISISYKNEIKTWIEGCIKSSATIPLVRETLVQYLNTINIITKQSKNDKMSIEIKNQILKTGNIDEAIAISETIRDLKLAVLENVRKSLEKLQLKFNLNIQFQGPNNNNCPFGIKDSCAVFILKEKEQRVCMFFNEDFDSVQIGITDKSDQWIGAHPPIYYRWENASWNEIYNDTFINQLKADIESYFEEIKKMN